MNGTQAAQAGGRGEPDAATLLSDLTALRHRTRADRHGYAFPLFLFGGLLLLGSLATAWWYRRRAERAGVETSTRAFLVAAGAAFAGFILGSYLLQNYSLALYGAWTVNLPLILFAATAFAAIGVYANRGFSALYVIAAGLLVLAWLERSVLLGVTGVLFTLTAVPATLHWSLFSTYVDANAVLYHLGFGAADRQLEVLQVLLVPAAILLIAGAVAALTRKKVV